jgi:hypothetical protein
VRKNRAKAGKTNGMSDDSENDDVKCSRGRAIATARVVSGLVSNEYGEEAHAPAPSAENGVAWRWRHEGREKVEWRTRWWQLRRGPSLSCGGIDG